MLKLACGKLIFCLTFYDRCDVTPDSYSSPDPFSVIPFLHKLIGTRKALMIYRYLFHILNTRRCNFDLDLLFIQQIYSHE